MKMTSNHNDKLQKLKDSKNRNRHRKKKGRHRKIKTQIKKQNKNKKWVKLTIYPSRGSSSMVV